MIKFFSTETLIESFCFLTQQTKHLGLSHLPEKLHFCPTASLVTEYLVLAYITVRK